MTGPQHHDNRDGSARRRPPATQPEPGTPRRLRISVVVANFNYERYVGKAIESALSLDWEDVEVIVVDDGSTDGSRDVIRGFSDRIVTVFAENAGQRVASNRGFERVTGDVVVFLDSDDVLPADLGTALASQWVASTAKAQFRMQRIGADDGPIGDPFPTWSPTPTSKQCREWLFKTSAYPTPPGSANAYAAWFLDRIFPLPPEVGESADSACLAAAPMHGDVLTLPEVIVGYRRHGGNDSDLLVHAGRFGREVRRARARWLFALRSAGRPPDERPLRRSRELLQFRAVSFRTAPDDEGLPGESRRRLLIDMMRSPFLPGPESWLQRLLIVGWGLGVLLVPGPLVGRLVKVRYDRS